MVWGSDGDSDDEDIDRNLRGERGFGGSYGKARGGEAGRGFGRNGRGGGGVRSSPGEGRNLAVGQVAWEGNRPLLQELLKEVHHLTKFESIGYKAKNLSKAFDAIKKCVIQVTDGTMAQSLSGIGHMIGTTIDRLLAKIKKSGGAASPASPPAPPLRAAPASAGPGRVLPDEAVRPLDDDDDADDAGGGGAPKPKKARVTHDVGLKELLAAGKLAVDQELTFRKQDRASGSSFVERGVLTEAGEILFRGTTHKKPGGFASAAWAHTGGSGKVTDGWGTVFAGETSLKVQAASQRPQLLSTLQEQSVNSTHPHNTRRGLLNLEADASRLSCP